MPLISYNELREREIQDELRRDRRRIRREEKLMPKIVAIIHPTSGTIHHPSGACHHISLFLDYKKIHSWASAEGRFARANGKVCGSCISVLGFQVPPLIAKEGI